MKDMFFQKSTDKGTTLKFKVKDLVGTADLNRTFSKGEIFFGLEKQNTITEIFLIGFLVIKSVNFLRHMTKRCWKGICYQYKSQ